MTSAGVVLGVMVSVRTSIQAPAATPVTHATPRDTPQTCRSTPYNRLCRGVCHEHGRGFACRRSCLKWCCSGDEGRPFGVALREEASNRLVLRWLKTVVVSDRGKGVVRGVR